ncbi:OmpA family protein [Rhizosphaericola mali]|uniref:OmpA family protein n=1 Tax=Rhizosphaericola mali TaxID=2545455 RepID=A0A5P2G453_9BACT|nr:OmpA family protein [Rhizosphaericola mali]QES89987.1 OmpA family protein [Rhizosphaericola mali]
MKYLKLPLLSLVAIAMMLASCSTWNNANQTQKGAAVGVGGGAVAGALVGKLAGNTALGAILGAAVGGGAGALIGKKMDKQAEDIKTQVPGAKVERVDEGITVEFSSKVLFGFDSYSLTDASKSTLNNLITVLNKYPDTNLEIQGHTDNKGTAEYNQNLSVQRATSVADYLKANGVSAARITTKGYGMTAPKYSNDTEEGRAGNRRVEFLITANQAMQQQAKQEAGQ